LNAQFRANKLLKVFSINMSPGQKSSFIFGGRGAAFGFYFMQLLELELHTILGGEKAK
jgi:hypothetical protein